MESQSDVVSELQKTRSNYKAVVWCLKSLKCVRAWLTRKSSASCRWLTSNAPRFSTSLQGYEAPVDGCELHQAVWDRTNAPPLFSPSCLRSAVSGNDHQAEADWPAGAVPLFPRWRGSDFRVGLLPLQPAAGPQGNLQLWEDSGGALPWRQPDWGATQGNDLWCTC